MNSNYYESLPDTGFVRLSTILKIIPVSRATWYAGMKERQFPKPIKLVGKRIAVWRVEDIKQLVEKCGNQEKEDQINNFNKKGNNGQL